MNKTANKRYVLLLAALVAAMLFAADGFAARPFGQAGIDQTQPADPAPRPADNPAPTLAPKPQVRSPAASSQPTPPANLQPSGSADPKKSTVNLERATTSELGEAPAGQQLVFTGVSPPAPVVPREQNITGASSVPAWMLRAAGLAEDSLPVKSPGTASAL